MKNFSIERMLQGHLRRRQQVLLISIMMDKFVCSLWDYDGRHWERQESLLNESGFARDADIFVRLERLLPTVLLEGDIAENIPCIVVLSNSFLFNVELNVPKLSLKDEQELVAWEAQASVPFEQPYTFTYQRVAEYEDMNVLRLYALSGDFQMQLANIWQKSMVRCVCLTVEAPVEEVAQRWYAGEELPNLLPKWKFTWKNLHIKDWWQELKASLARPQLAKDLGVIFLVGMLALAGAWGFMTYQAEQEAKAAEVQEMQALEQRKAQATALAEQKKRKEDGRYARDLAVLAEQVNEGVWLTELSTLNAGEQAGAGRTFSIKGEGEFPKVQAFVAKLEAAGCQVKKLQLQNVDGTGKVQLDLEVIMKQN